MEILIYLYIVAVIAATVFTLVMLYRFVRAHEELSRHLLEIARDFKQHVNKD